MDNETSTDHLDQEFRQGVDRRLSMLAASLNTAMDCASMLILQIEVEAAHHNDFPLSANLTRFINQYRFIFNEKVMRLDKEVEALRKDWQLKTMEFDQEKGEWK